MAKFDDKRNEFILSTGRRVYANRGILGINVTPEGKFDIREGFDGNIWTDYQRDCRKDGENVLTDAELRELADTAIEMWTKFRASLR